MVEIMAKKKAKKETNVLSEEEKILAELEQEARSELKEEYSKEVKTELKGRMKEIVEAKKLVKKLQVSFVKLKKKIASEEISEDFFE